MDQAEGLRAMSKKNKPPVKVMAVTSGKGGVGKTNVSINLAVSLARLNRKVMVLDADLGLANVDVLLGLQPSKNLSHVLNGEAALDEIVLDGPGGIKVIPASSGVKQMAELTPAEHAGVIRAFSEMTKDPEVLIVDTAAGISDSVVSFCHAAQEVVVVVCDEPSSITDAYATIKVLSKEYDLHRFRVIANMVHSQQEGRELFTKLSRVTDRFLEASLIYMGSVPYDTSLRKAVQKQRAVVEAFPNSKAAKSFEKLAAQVEKWQVPSNAGSRLEFFVERLVKMNFWE